MTEFGKGLKVLVVDDEEDVREVLATLLDQHGFEVATASSVATARAKRLDGPFDVLLADKNLPDGTGLELAADLKAGGADCEVVLMTAYASLESAIEAVRLGVADYLTKPFDNLETIVTRMSRVVEMLALRRQNAKLVKELTDKNRQLEDLVVRDSLTRLFNHAYLQEYIEREVMRSRRHALTFGLILLDIDDFRKINETHGHPVGDKVIQTIGDLLASEVRKSDVAIRLRGEDIAARYGGDEFAVVLPETDKNGAAIKAERLRSRFESIDLAAKGLPKISISVGVAAFPLDAPDRASLVAAADSALFAAKAAGKNQMIPYSPAMASASAQHTRRLEQEASWRIALDRSIANRSFKYAYQPIVKSETEDVIAFEALCRPTDAAFASPQELFSAAERAGRIHELGRVLRELALEPMAQLPPGVALFVNLHPLELTNDLLDATEQAISGRASRIVLEITETTALKDPDLLRRLRARLKEQGFRIAVDDLGSGYSGLHSLTMLEPEFVKLDMAILRGIRSNSREARLIRHILDYANGEDIQVIAEGIETQEEREVVAGLGVHFLQGFYFAKPGPAFPVLGGGNGGGASESRIAGRR